MQQSTVESSASIFLMPSLYQETVQLLLDARYYFENDGKILETRLEGFRKHQFAMEMSRITLRLSCVMAWLSVQRAICEGEITREEARRDYALDGIHICLDSDVTAEHMLPEAMNELLENSRMLYERIYRLEQQHGE